ncbi:hypothetical protein [Clostridium botulinum]|uniref:hypothetical protein n=1 Tax=Clostridium botulinum TaxID=1491 RepID=UPI0004CFF6EE|nr:hypothetical protein [Clostridium botulinum]APC82181.1 hypothetical protein NPD12_3719 [Clostridium botulinum]AXG97780.1 hypothetical protein AGE31_19520 [Clostridium botulinum]MBY6773575.1 hypothetical protein [Clostridium botulinum]MBY6886006.1 hypothetical protein [Clostridium botulinum]
MNYKDIEKIFKINHQQLMEDSTIRRAFINNSKENIALEPIKNYMVDKYGTYNPFIGNLLKRKKIDFKIVYPEDSVIKENTIKLVNVKLLEIINRWSFVGERGYHYGYNTYYFILPNGTKSQKGLKPSNIVDVNLRYKDQIIDDEQGYILIEDNH